jgi:hypothetical protein
MTWHRFAVAYAVALACIACAPQTTTTQTPSICHPGFPRGIAAGLWPDVRFALRFHITAAYKFKDPDLAHERVPRMFVDGMNRVSGYQKYAVADGPDVQAHIYLNFSSDATDDHYGVAVRMSGPARYTGEPGVTHPGVHWFRFSQEPIYRTGSKLIEGVAIKTAQFLNNGWTC